MKDYSLFDKVILKFVPWIREQTNKSPDNIIRIKIIDIKKEIPELRVMRNTIYETISRDKKRYV